MDGQDIRVMPSVELGCVGMGIHIPCNTLCNTSNLSRLYNPRHINLTRYNSSLAIRVSQFFFSFQPPVFFFSKTLSPTSTGFLFLSLTLHSLNPTVLPPLSQPPCLLCASPSSPQPLHHRYQHNQLDPSAKTKKK